MATKSAGSKKYHTKAGNPTATPPSRRWSSKVTTDSTHPGPGLFKQSAKKIAEGLEKKSVSPDGPGQAMRMLTFYENRAGHNLSAERKHALDHAKQLVHEKVEGEHKAKRSTRPGSSASKQTSSTKRTTSRSTHSRKGKHVAS
jgi:hypothetical protein